MLDSKYSNDNAIPWEVSVNTGQPVLQTNRTISILTITLIGLFSSSCVREPIQTTSAYTIRNFQEQTNFKEEPKISIYPTIDFYSLPEEDYLANSSLTAGLASNKIVASDRATTIFIHGLKGSPANFFSFKDHIARNANVLFFLYSKRDGLLINGERLRRSLANAPADTTVIAHSAGALLINFAGATDLKKDLCKLRVIYLNPLLGGSYYSDGFMGSGRYSIFYPLIRHFAIDNLIRDLKPESFFQQVMFGESSNTSCFAESSTVIVTESDETKNGITKARFREVFGKTRSRAIRQMGKKLALKSWLRFGHQGPLEHPEIVVPKLPDSLRRGSD